MKKPFRVSLKAGQKLFVNGAVLRVDRKTAVEFLNDVDFLLETHVLQAEEATTPLRQLYFVAQAIVIDRSRSAEARNMYDLLHNNFMKAFPDPELRSGLVAARDLILDGRYYEALRTIRTLYSVEERMNRQGQEACASNEMVGA